MTQAEKTTVLLVEDDSVTRELTAFMLKDLGYGVHVFENGAQAVAAYRKKPTDMVILDISMPVFNGVEALRQILRNDPAARVIMLTGVDQTDVAESCVAAGALDYIQKGLGPEALNKSLDVAMGRVGDEGAPIQ